MTSLVPDGRRLPAPTVELATELVSDITCTRRGCGRTVTAPLLAIIWSSPCPLCTACPECRHLCGKGLVEHGIAREAIR